MNDVPSFNEGFVFDRNEIMNEDREPDPVAPLRFGDMLHIIRHPPTGAERDDDVALTNQAFETAPVDEQIGEIMNRGLEYRKKKSRVAGDHRQHAGELAPKYRRRPNCLPRRIGARWVQVSGQDGIEADRFELLGVDAEPAKSDASGSTEEPLGFDIDLERHALQPGRIGKMIEIAEKVLDLEPYDRLTVLADARVFRRGFVGACDGGAQPEAPIRVASTKRSVESSMPRPDRPRGA